MNYTTKKFFMILGVTLLMTACKKQEDVQSEKINSIPEFFSPAFETEYGTKKPIVSVKATASDRLHEPQDLEFHPTRNQQRWGINKSNSNTGGSTLTIKNAGGEEMPTDKVEHLLVLPCGAVT